MVSKIASDQAKPDGILWVLPGGEAAFLAPLPVGKIPGVGKVTGKFFQRMGIRTIGDLERWKAAAAIQEIESLGRRLGLALSRTAGGENQEQLPAEDREWGPEEHAKSIGHEETFSQDIADQAELDAALADLSQRVAARLRAHGLYARTVTLKLRYASFRTLTRARTLEEPTHLDGVILETARRLFHKHWDRRQKIRLLGVQASGLSCQPGQANLWSASRDEKWSRALAAADQLRERFGFSSIGLAAGLPPDKPEEPAG